jgi:hypothetical protein
MANKHSSSYSCQVSTVVTPTSSSTSWICTHPLLHTSHAGIRSSKLRPQKLQTVSPSHASNSCATPSQTSCCCCRFVVCIVCRPGASALNIFVCFLFQCDIRHQLNKKPNEFSNFCGHKSSCSKGFLTHFKTLN